MKPTIKDQEFFDICYKLRDINPVIDLNIPPQILNDTILDEIIDCLKKMDCYYGPQEKFNAFGDAIQKITSLFNFTLLKDLPEASDLLPIVINCLILAKPERLWWTCRFLNYFMTENQKMGHEGYNLTQIESAMIYVNRYYYSKKD